MRAHPGPVPILGELRHRRAPDPPEDRRHQPVERGDEEVLPLKPDGGGADAVDGAGERHRHLGVRADAKALANHQPWPEAAPAEEILAAVADAVSRDQADGGDDDEVDDDDDPVEQGKIHIRLMRAILRDPAPAIFAGHAWSRSLSLVSEDHNRVDMPRSRGSQASRHNGASANHEDRAGECHPVVGGDAVQKRRQSACSGGSEPETDHETHGCQHQAPPRDGPGELAWRRAERGSNRQIPASLGNEGCQGGEQSHKSNTERKHTEADRGEGANPATGGDWLITSFTSASSGTGTAA